MFSVKSYNYSKLILCYGHDKGAMVSISWNSQENVFKLAFGAANNALNAHSLIREQLEAHLNQHRNLAQIVQLLHETYEPLISISKLPTLPQLGIFNTVSINRIFSSNLPILQLIQVVSSLVCMVNLVCNFTGNDLETNSNTWKGK